MTDRRCPHCDEPILPGEPALPVNDGADLWHRECLLRQVVGSVAHQEGRCSCYGGEGEDDAELTPRQAAIAAAAAFVTRQLLS